MQPDRGALSPWRSDAPILMENIKVSTYLLSFAAYVFFVSDKQVICLLL